MALLRRNRQPALLASSANDLRRRMAQKGITAASTLIDLSDPDVARKQANKQRARPTEWQKSAVRHYDELSEVRAAGRWMADAQSRMRLHIAVLPEDPDQPPVPVAEALESPEDVKVTVTPEEADTANAILKAITGPDGDMQEILRVTGLNLFIQGESWLVGTEDEEYADDDNPTGEIWRALSVQELTVDDRGGWSIRPWDNAKDDELEKLDPETTILVRSYRRHPVWKSWPDGALRSANLICEELLLATQSLMASYRSRLASGILPIPDDLEMEPDEDSEVEAGMDSMSILMRRLIAHMSTPISDPRSAAAYAPYLLALPKDLISVIKPIDISRTIDPTVIDRMEHLVQRLAIAFDMPPELLTGRGDINHWNAIIIDEDGVRMHIEPYTQIFTDAITTKILRPRLKAANVANVNRFLVWGDPTEVMAHPNRANNTVLAYDRFEASGHTLRTVLGLSDEEAPDEAEIKTRVDRQIELAGGGGQQAPAGDQNAGDGAGGGGDGAKNQDVASEQKGPAGERSTVAEPISKTGVPKPVKTPKAKAPKAPKPSRTAEFVPPVLTASNGNGHRSRTADAFAKIEVRLLRDLLVYADGELTRAIEKGAARLKTAHARGKSNADVAALPKAAELAVIVGRDEVRNLGVNEDDLFTGGFAALSAYFAARTAQARADALKALQRAGINLDDYDEYGKRIHDEWTQASEDHDREAQAFLLAALAGIAAPMLFGEPHSTEDRGETDTLKVPPSVIRDALGIAGGGPPADAPSVTGLLGGADFVDFLDRIPGFNRTGFLWEVGYPATPFDPHQELGGLEFTGWNDPGLAADPGDFPYVSVYSPGDHRGCQCTVTPLGDVAVEEPTGDEGE